MHGWRSVPSSTGSRCDEPGCDCDDQLLLLCREHSRGEVTPGMRAECGATDLVVAVAG
jgi:hypothetical protein